MIMHAPPPGGTRDGEVASRELVRERLDAVATALRARDVPAPAPDGKLLRPLLAYALVPCDRRADLDDRFWFGALAVQMAHEASLLHDDMTPGKFFATTPHTASREGVPRNELSPL